MCKDYMLDLNYMLATSIDEFSKFVNKIFGIKGIMQMNRITPMNNETLVGVRNDKKVIIKRILIIPVT